MKQIMNRAGAKVQLQDNFTDRQLELIRQNELLAPSGFPLLYAMEYHGKIYLENLMGVVLQIIPKDIK